jgi:hypothetical protein
MGKITQRMILGRYGVKTDPPTGKKTDLNKDPRFNKQHQQYEKQGYTYINNNQYIDKKGELYDVVNPEGGTNLIDMWTNQARPTTLKATSKRLEPVPIQTIKPYTAPADTTWKQLTSKENISRLKTFPISKNKEKNNEPREWSEITPLSYSSVTLTEDITESGQPTYVAPVINSWLLKFKGTIPLDIDQTKHEVKNQQLVSVTNNLKKSEVDKNIIKDLSADKALKGSINTRMKQLPANAPERIKKLKIADDFFAETLPIDKGGFGFKEHRLASIFNPDSSYFINKKTGERIPGVVYSSEERRKEVLDSLRNPNIYLKYLDLK